MGLRLNYEIHSFYIKPCNALCCQSNQCDDRGFWQIACDIIIIIIGLLKIQTSQPESWIEFKRYTTRIYFIKTFKREVFTEKDCLKDYENFSDKEQDYEQISVA